MSLDSALLEAHARDDRQSLVGLYAQAAEMSEQSGNLPAACFYMTHAYIFALEMAHPDTPRLHSWLKHHGREE